jgi:superfamily I DNA/RNA helicase
LFDFERNILKQLPYEINNNEGLVKIIFELIRAKDIHPNDICILAQNIELLRNIDYIIRREFNEKTLTTFETKEVYEHLSDQKLFDLEIKSVRRIKKIGFRLNGGTIKLSTIHSFKGWEIPTLFLIIDSNVDEEIYTAITRARHNIIILNTTSNKYYKFFKDFSEQL